MSEPQVEPLIVGAVAYTPTVVPIWEGIRDYFADSRSPMDFVLFSNYARQVDALRAGHVDIAWNTNLAWVRTVQQTGGACRALAMRDTDTTFHSVLVSRAGAGLSGPKDLAGRRLALGSRDSTQAAILPLYFLRREGVTEGDLDLVRIDTDLGKHGDTGRSEYDALQLVLDGDADAAAVGNTTWAAIGAAGAMPDLAEFWRTPHFSHCNFTALDTLPAERTTPWVDHLLAMDWEREDHRRILELEGLRRWVLPAMAGYDTLFEAVAEQGVPPRW